MLRAAEEVPHSQTHFNRRAGVHVLESEQGAPGCIETRSRIRVRVAREAVLIGNAGRIG